MKPANSVHVMPPVPKLTAFCGVEFEDGTHVLVIKGFSSEAAAAEFCLKLAALGIVTVTPAGPTEPEAA